MIVTHIEDRFIRVWVVCDNCGAYEQAEYDGVRSKQWSLRRDNHQPMINVCSGCVLKLEVKS